MVACVCVVAENDARREAELQEHLDLLNQLDAQNRQVTHDSSCCLSCLPRSSRPLLIGYEWQLREELLQAQAARKSATTQQAAQQAELAEHAALLKASFGSSGSPHACSNSVVLCVLSFCSN
jgi:hypothetical protein